MRLWLVAAFAERPFQGNPAGVCLLEEALPAQELQLIARELRQPETAFIRRETDGWAVRWFSPEVEVELCGHATLAAAHVLWSEGLAAEGAITFFAASTTLTATRGNDGLIWLDFPSLPGAPGHPRPEVVAAVGAPPALAARHADRWLFEYRTAAEVRGLRPDFPALRRTGVRSLIATAPSDMDGYDIVSRNFAPLVGVDEDQVTGMAHTCLAPHWRARLGDALSCWQASPRGGGMRTRLAGERVALGGRAIIEVSGAWRLDQPAAALKSP